MAVVGCSNTAVSAAGFTAIPNPRSAFGGRVWLKTRDNASFLVSDTSAGTNYFTTVASQPLELVVQPDGTSGSAVLCYVKGTSTTTLEVFAC